MAKSILITLLSIAALTYAAQYVATGGAAGTGAVSTSVTYSIEYQ